MGIFDISTNFLQCDKINWWKKRKWIFRVSVVKSKTAKELNENPWNKENRWKDQRLKGIRVKITATQLFVVFFFTADRIQFFSSFCAARDTGFSLISNNLACLALGLLVGLSRIKWVARYAYGTAGKFVSFEASTFHSNYRLHAHGRVVGPGLMAITCFILWGASAVASPGVGSMLLSSIVTKKLFNHFYFNFCLS